MAISRASFVVSGKLGLAIVLIVAALVRFYGLDRHGLWYDEQVSLLVAVGRIHSYEYSEPIAAESRPFKPADFWAHNNPSHVVEATIKDGGNNLTYNLFLHYWINYFGTHDFSARLPSLLFGLMTICAVYLLSLAIFTRSIATLAAILAALHPYLIRYSQEARSYSLAILITTVGTYLFVILLKRTRESRSTAWLVASYGVLASLSLMTHYLSISVFLGHAFYCIVFVRDRRVLRRLAVCASLAAITLATWMEIGGKRGLDRIAVLNHSYETRAANPLPNEKMAYPVSMKYLGAGWMNCLFYMSGNMLQSAGYQIRYLVGLLIIPFALIFAGIARFRHDNSRNSWLALLGILSVSSLCLSTLLAFRAGHTVSFLPLYHIWCVPYVAILLALGFAAVWKHRPFIRCGLICPVFVQFGLMFFSLNLVYQDIPKRRAQNPYWALAEQISASWRPDNIVLFGSWADSNLTNIYLSSDSPVIEAVVRTELTPHRVEIRGATTVVIDDLARTPSN